MKLAIITYHYIKNFKKEKFKNLNGLDIEVFKKQLNFLHKNYEIISFDQITKKEFSSKKNKVILTFDDGYIEHYSLVTKELRKKNLTGYFFPVTNVIKKNQVLNINKIHIILNFYEDKKILLKQIKNYLANFVSNKYLEKTISTIKKRRFDDKNTSIIKSLLQNKLEKKIKVKTINYFFNKLIDDKKKFHKNFYLSGNHIVKMLKKNMQFGYHGASHSRFSEMTKINQAKEIKNSINFFKKFSYHPEVFCYPHGSYNKATITILKKLKIKYGLTVKHGIIDLKKKIDMLSLPRIDAKILFKSLDTFN